MVRRRGKTAEGERVIVYYEEKASKRWPEGFVVISLDAFRLLRSHNLPKDAHHVLYWLWEHLEFQNFVGDVTNERIGRAMPKPIHRTRVSRMMSALENAEMIQRGDSRGLVYLNPNQCFRGSDAELMRARARWDDRKAAKFSASLVGMG